MADSSGANPCACVYALARTVGWMAQWKEMLVDPEYKTARPRQFYTGVDRRRMAALRVG